MSAASRGARWQTCKNGSRRGLSVHTLTTAMNPCVGERLDGPQWHGLPLGRFAPPGHSGLAAVAAAQDTLFVWLDGASPAEVHTRRGSHHYRRQAGVLDIMAAWEDVRIRHDVPEAPGACLLVALDAELACTAAARRPADRRIYSRFGLRQPHLHRLALALHQHCAAGQPLGRLHTESLSLLLAQEAYGLYADRLHECMEPAHARKGLDQRQLAALRALIEDRLADDLGLADLAAAAGCSRPHFVRLFRGSFGESPHQHLLRRRVDRAQQLLLHSDAGMAEIATACGFSSASHLSHCFAHWLGVPPARYRMQGGRPAGR